MNAKNCKSILILYFVLQVISLPAQNFNSFKMQHPITNEIICKYSFTKRDTIILKDIKPISGMSITGQVNFMAEKSLVRIVLIDIKGKDYLVYENSPYIANSDIVCFTKSCRETALLNAVTPFALKIIVKNAIVSIDAIQYALWNNDNSLNNIKFKSNSIRQLQTQNIAQQINTYNAAHHKLWIAGETPLTAMSYEELKTLYCGQDNYESNGYEYYIGGFFEIPSSKSTQENLESSIVRNNFVSNFDWRNRHGINWMTPVKNQQMPVNPHGNGGCWSFAPIGVTEAILNLYYNRKVDLDLSEQDII